MQTAAPLVYEKGQPLPRGSLVGRWQVVRRSSPQERPQWTGMISAQMCRCVCGAERVVLDRDLKLRRSTGCERKRCREAWKLAEPFAVWLGVDRARELARELVEVESTPVDVARAVAERFGILTQRGDV